MLVHNISRKNYILIVDKQTPYGLEYFLGEPYLSGKF